MQPNTGYMNICDSGAKAARALRWCFVPATTNNTDREQHFLSVRAKRTTQRGKIWKEQAPTVPSLKQLKVLMNFFCPGLGDTCNKEVNAPLPLFSSCLPGFVPSRSQRGDMSTRVLVWSHGSPDNRVIPCRGAMKFCYGEISIDQHSMPNTWIGCLSPGNFSV